MQYVIALVSGSALGAGILLVLGLAGAPPFTAKQSISHFNSLDESRKPREYMASSGRECFWGHRTFKQDRH